MTLDEILLSLGPDECRVLHRVAERLYAGQSTYGYLKLAKEKRDFKAETAEEMLDACAYLAMQLIKGDDTATAMGTVIDIRARSRAVPQLVSELAIYTDIDTGRIVLLEVESGREMAMPIKVAEDINRALVDNIRKARSLR
jgi:hypothetical protein